MNIAHTTYIIEIQRTTMFIIEIQIKNRISYFNIYNFKKKAIVKLNFYHQGVSLGPLGCDHEDTSVPGLESESSRSMEAGNRGNPLEGGVDWELGLEALLRSASALLSQGLLEVLWMVRMMETVLPLALSIHKNRDISKAGKQPWPVGFAECVLSPTFCLLDYFLHWDYWAEKFPLAKSHFPQGPFPITCRDGGPRTLRK